MELCSTYSSVPGFFCSALHLRELRILLCRVVVHSHCCRVFPWVNNTKYIYPFPSWWASGFDERHCLEHSSSWLLVNTCIHFCWDYTHEWCCWLWGGHMLSFSRYCQTDLQSGCTIWHSFQQYTSVGPPPHPCQRLVFSTGQDFDNTPIG